MQLFNNKYRTDSLRLKTWDYSLSGFYYVTICVLNHKHSFGVVDSQSVNLNGLGGPNHVSSWTYLNTLIMYLLPIT